MVQMDSGGVDFLAGVALGDLDDPLTVSRSGTSSCAITARIGGCRARSRFLTARMPSTAALDAASA
jgi:hypothetical protein